MSAPEQDCPRPPVPAAGVVCLRGEAVLLVRRGQAPARGSWSLPGGRLQPGETARQAAVREVREETGLEINLLDAVDVYDAMIPPYHYCVADFRAEPVDVTAEPAAADDVTDARWVRFAELPNYQISPAVGAVLARARWLRNVGARRALPPSQVAGLYVITDDTLIPGRSHLDVARAAVAGGAAVVQLRDKQRETGELVAIAREIAAICRRGGALFIVNDRVDVALAAGADGVHLGVDDMPVADARRILGAGLIGYSPETLEQAAQAAPDGADYLGVGDLFGTTSKSDAGRALGLEHLARVREACSLPIVGIGGITLPRVAAVLDGGAVGVAVLSAVVKADDMAAATRELAREVARCAALEGG